MRKRLTDKSIAALRPAATGKRYVVMDSVVSNLGVRVSASGRKSFVLIARFNAKHPVRRSLGPCGRLSIGEARDKARDWLSLVIKGVDPKRHRTDQTFGELAEKYFAHIESQRQGHEVERCIRRELLPAWQKKPIAEVTKRDVINLVEAVVARGRRCSAHHVLSYARRIFNFAIARDLIEHSPCDRIDARTLIGEKVVRQRVLSDDEIRSFWRACENVGYPYGPLWQLLLVTGARRSEIAKASWPEVDVSRAILTVPPERFKSNAKHSIPLSQLALGIIESLPNHEYGRFLFTGLTLHAPVNGWSKARRKLSTGSGAPYVIHDLRRTVRTRLSALRVPDHIAEMVIGHGRKGIARVYDQHRYLGEMREALDAWAVRLAEIVQG